MFGLALTASLATVAVVAGAGAELSRNLWGRTPWLAPAYGLLGLGLVAHLDWMLCWWSRSTCFVFSVAVLVMSLAVLVRARVWVGWRVWLPLTAATTSVLAVVVGHAFEWGGLRDPFGAVANRYGSQPGDNLLQYKFAYHLWNNLSTVQFYSDWNGSDRPPLQSGVLLLTRPFESVLGIRGNVALTDVHAMQWGIAASIVAQLIWIPGMYALLRALRFRPGVAVLTIAFVSVVPLAVWNTSYTWPKMMSAGFALAAFAILVTLLLDRPSRVEIPLVAAGALVMLAFLTHGGAAFVAPALILLALMALRGHGIKQLLGNSILNVGVAGLLYLPWILYGRYADPNHSRLLKWHFAGVIAPDNRPFLPTLVDAYRHASTRYLLDARKTNLARVFDHDLSARLHPDKTWPDAWRSQDFFSSTFTIGLGTVLLVGLVVAWLVLTIRRRPHSREMGLSLVVIAACLACMVVWALVLFLPDGATVHVGTYIWLLVFAAVPFAWTARWSTTLAAVVALAQMTYTAIVYQEPNSHFVDPHFSTAPALVLGAGVVGLTLTIAATIRADRRVRRSALTGGTGKRADHQAGLVTS